MLMVTDSGTSPQGATRRRKDRGGARRSASQRPGPPGRCARSGSSAQDAGEVVRRLLEAQERKGTIRLSRGRIEVLDAQALKRRP